MENMIRWALGFIIGAAWSAANLIFTINILKISILKKGSGRLSALILLKFPVLYLILFLLLISRAFPAISILTGLLAGLVITGISKLWLRQT